MILPEKIIFSVYIKVKNTDMNFSKGYYLILWDEIKYYPGLVK